MLAIARDDVVQYVQLEAKDGKPEFKLLKKLKVGYTITAFKVSYNNKYYVTYILCSGLIHKLWLLWIPQKEFI